MLESSQREHSRSWFRCGPTRALSHCNEKKREELSDERREMHAGGMRGRERTEKRSKTSARSVQSKNDREGGGNYDIRGGKGRNEGNDREATMSMSKTEIP